MKTPRHSSSSKSQSPKSPAAKNQSPKSAAAKSQSAKYISVKRVQSATTTLGLSMSLGDYLECIEMLGRAGKLARVRDIAAALKVKTPSVEKGVAALKSAGLVKQEPYGAVELTEEGKKRATELCARHELLKKFLVRLGVSPETAETDGCKMEHFLSEETLGRVAAFLDGACLAAELEAAAPAEAGPAAGACGDPPEGAAE